MTLTIYWAEPARTFLFFSKTRLNLTAHSKAVQTVMLYMWAYTQLFWSIALYTYTGHAYTFISICPKYICFPEKQSTAS